MRIWKKPMAHQTGKRVKSSTRDTSYNLAQTYYGLVELSLYLLRSHEYVMLGSFTTDPLEK